MNASDAWADTGRPARRAVPPPPPPGRRADGWAERSRGGAGSSFWDDSGEQPQAPRRTGRAADPAAGYADRVADDRDRAPRGYDDGAARRPGERRRAADRQDPRYDARRDDRYDEPRRGSSAGRYADGYPDGGYGEEQSRRSARRSGQYPDPRRAPEPERGGGRLRGALAVLGVFLVTLAGAAVDSFVGVGLGTVTFVALVGSTLVAAWLVRRRDILSVVAAPPLVFIATAIVDAVVAPSASLSAATMAALLIRGFPAMGVATGLALIIWIVRAAARR